MKSVFALAALALHLERLPDNPIITPAMFAEAGVPDEGGNINGPSLIRVPDWLPPERRADPKARYYLYFGHHVGGYIRMAWAEKVGGPYRIYQPSRGVLSLEAKGTIPAPVGGRMIPLSDTLAVGGHIASPDVLVDDEKRRFVMFFHGYGYRAEGEAGWKQESQQSFVAVSGDGLEFIGAVEPRALGRSYFRVFPWRGAWRASAFADMLRATTPDDPFSPYEEVATLESLGNLRHTAIRVDDDGITLFFTRKGDAPERLFAARVEEKPTGWQAGEPKELLRPVEKWEGAEFAIAPSVKGKVEPANQLRDPAWFRDDDGQEYLLYTVAGEQGIAIARLIP